ncbi:hypothetical protein ACFU99_44600 [Streptomyces sp. NPDC057654]|uniref:hypothetical protein n=1 Tax=Streptomyces sp. NPDC057654 TaxID=3346196 RepID=UPI0036825270
MNLQAPLAHLVFSDGAVWLAPVLRAILTPWRGRSLTPVGQSYAAFHDGPLPTRPHQRHHPDQPTAPPVPDSALATEEQR